MHWFSDQERSQYVHKIGNLTLLSRKKEFASTELRV